MAGNGGGSHGWSRVRWSRRVSGGLHVKSGILSVYVVGTGRTGCTGCASRSGRSVQQWKFYRARFVHRDTPVYADHAVDSGEPSRRTLHTRSRHIGTIGGVYTGDRPIRFGQHRVSDGKRCRVAGHNRTLYRGGSTAGVDDPGRQRVDGPHHTDHVVDCQLPSCSTGGRTDCADRDTGGHHSV